MQFRSLVDKASLNQRFLVTIPEQDVGILGIFKCPCDYPHALVHFLLDSVKSKALKPKPNDLPRNANFMSDNLFSNFSARFAFPFMFQNRRFEIRLEVKAIHEYSMITILVESKQLVVDKVLGHLATCCSMELRKASSLTKVLMFQFLPETLVIHFPHCVPLFSYDHR